MNGTLKLGKIAGIEVKIHPTFFFLILWVVLSALWSGATAAGVITEVGYVAVLFLCVVLHELGHALVARRYGIQTQDILLLPIGGIARVEKMPEKPKEELLVALAGPAVNGLISVFIFLGLILTGFFSAPQSLTVALDSFWFQILAANVMLALFNLLPAFPMDGGRVLRALLSTHMDTVEATQTAATVGKVLAIILAFVGFFLNPWLILTALIIWSGANSEAQTVQLKANLKGLIVRDATIRQFYQVEANQTLESVFDLSLRTGQQTIPVISNSRYLGFIQRPNLLESMERLGRRAPAYAAIDLKPEGLSPDLPLVEALPKFTHTPVLPVVQDEAMFGIITPESIQQVMWLNQHQSKAGAQPPEEYIHTP